LTACSSGSEASGDDGHCAIEGLGGNDSVGVLGGAVGTDSNDDALTVIGGDTMATINYSGAMGGELDARSSSSLVADHRRIRIAIGSGRRRKPWGGSRSLARAREELTVEGDVTSDARINESIDKSVLSMSSTSLGAGNIVAAIGDSGAIGAICSSSGSIAKSHKIGPRERSHYTPRTTQSCPVGGRSS
jgi:hypothetical protein